MDLSLQIKTILYSEINNIQEQNIQLKLTKRKSQEVINEILSNCYQKIASIQNNKEESLGMFAESFLHYLLTSSLIPSQRKIMLNNTEIDIVIPDLKTLKARAQDSLIMCFPKTSNVSEIKQQLGRLEKIQPITENIWFIVQNSFTFNGKMYEIKEKNGSFSRILDDINKFLMARKQTRFKIFKTQLN